MSSPSPPPLDVRFGSSLHTEYGGAATAAGPTILPSSAVVVSPSLLGSERNVTNFHEIRDELERIAREDKNDSGWSFERNVGRDGVIKLPSRALMNRAGSVNDAVQRICQYFSIQHDTVGVGVLCRRGRPRIQYCSDQGHEGRNVTVIAFVGSTCTLSLRHQTRNATDPPAVMLSLSNNAVVAIGSGVLREGWEYGVRPVGDSASGDDVPGHIPTTVDTSANMPELFTVVVRGRSSAFVDRPVLSFEQPPSCARLGSSWMSAAPSEVSPHGSASDENSYESVGDRHGRRSRGRDRRRIGGSTTTSTCYRAPSRSSSSNRENNCHRDDHYPKRRRSRY